jgi:outer membrane protein assembly factor BamA
MKETIPTGLLATGTISGSTGGMSAGLGFAANWDSRDNTFSAHSGSFYQVTGLFYRNAFGSDYTFTDIQIDARNFFEIGRTHVLAVQAGGEFIEGLPPFQSLAKFGGSNILRGYFDGRYRDKNGVALQAEYRIPVWWRFGIVGFAGVAQVADKINHFASNRFWFAGGLGLRFFWNPEERINLRLDYGIGTNSSGMYVTVTEAF